MNIKGLTNKVDVINSVIDNIENSNFVNAVDTLNQLKEIEIKSTIYNGKVYDYKKDKYVSFDEFKAKQKENNE